MQDSDRDTNLRRGSVAAGLSFLGAFLAGAGGLVGGFVATVNGDFIGGGIYLLAAAVAFGLSANAVFRR